VELAIAPMTQRHGLGDCDEADRDALATVLVDVLERLDRLYEQPIPYMMWLNQRPTTDAGYEDAWFNIELVSPWRRAGVPRFIAAAEVACHEYFNPVIPEQLAEQLRRPAPPR
jgi:UDPglucose--hexose-1-phosphate uridylyltransferase